MSDRSGASSNIPVAYQTTTSKNYDFAAVLLSVMPKISEMSSQLTDRL
jgi:hypothetical protein